MIEDDLRLAPTVERWSETSGYRALVGRTRIDTILLIKADHIGDFILSLDAMASLRRDFPHARIDLVCAPWNQELAHSLGLFGRIFPLSMFGRRADSEQHPDFDPEMTAEFREIRYDLAVDLRIDNDTRVILRHTTATYKVGFDAPEHREVMTVFLPHYLPPQSDTNIGMHQSLLMLRLARTVADLFIHGRHGQRDDVEALLLGRVAVPPKLDLSMARGKLLVIVNTSSGRVAKNWPADRFRRLVRWMAQELGCVVLLTGAPDQREETAETIAFCGSPLVLSAVGQTTMREAIGLVAQASLFVGNDSALTHVAARLGVPTVALFSGIDPSVMWAARGPETTVLRAPVPCSPCHILHLRDCRGEHACMRNISEASVRAAVRRHLFVAARYGEAAVEDRAELADHPMLRGWASGSEIQVPQRYADNRERYERIPGRLPLEQLLQGFTAGSLGNRGDLNRFYMFAHIFDQLVKEQIHGDVAELGVYRGNTASMLAGFARQIGATAYLLDTFEGFAAADLAGVDGNKRPEFADTSLDAVRALVGTANTRFVQGYFPDTASEIPGNARFCLVHIDCDLYAPFKAALAFFYDRLEPGGFLVMHDYASLHWDGAERAVDEFFADKPESVVPIPDGSGTVVVRRARRPDPLANWRAQSRHSGFARAWVAIGDTADALRSGWAQPEGWGVWGLGPSHVLALPLLHTPEDDVELAMEVTAPLPAGRTAMEVELRAGGETLAVWRFDAERNTGVRVVRVPHAAILPATSDTEPVLLLEFRPDSTESPHALDPANPDTRPLGLGLIRLRQRPLPPLAPSSPPPPLAPVPFGRRTGLTSPARILLARIISARISQAIRNAPCSPGSAAAT